MWEYDNLLLGLTEGDGEGNDTDGEAKDTNGCGVAESRTKVTSDLSLGRDEKPLVELWCERHCFGQLIAELLLRIEVGVDRVTILVVIVGGHCEYW